MGPTPGRDSRYAMASSFPISARKEREIAPASCLILTRASFMRRAFISARPPGRIAVGHSFIRGGEDLLIIAKSALQEGKGPQAVGIAGVLREDGHDQQIHWIPFIRLGHCHIPSPEWQCMSRLFARPSLTGDDVHRFKAWPGVSGQKLRTDFTIPEMSDFTKKFIELSASPAKFKFI